MAFHCTYVRTADRDSLIAALVDVLTRHGYSRYDPFAGGTGTPPRLKTFVRHFVGQPDNGWIRILGEGDEAVLVDLSEFYPVIYAALGDDRANVAAWQNKQTASVEAFIRPASTAPRVAEIIERSKPVPSPNRLPDELDQIARDRGINPDQVGKMMDKITGNLFRKMQADPQAQNQARALFAGTKQTDWNSPAARQLSAIMESSDAPEHWRDPDFAAVRDAYQAARMLRKNAKASLMPDERSALSVVPNVLEYEAVYAGK
jgi:hypothetical protein